MLELQEVTRLYGSRPGVRNVSLAVPVGSRTVIVGPSGSGKTTLLRLIAGFETLDQGSITLAGRPLASMDISVPPHKRRISYVPQEGALFPHMSVAANIGFAIPANAPDREARIDALMTRVGLSTSMRRLRPHQLSGGQQQRVALARALAQQPDLMLMDEPFSALDTGLRGAMRTMVGELLAQSGITAVLVTHDQAEALAFADHLVVMRGGSVADAGPPQRVYDHPVDAETARFLGDALILPAEIASDRALTPLGPLAVHAPDRSATTILIRPEQIVLDAPTGDSSATQPRVRIRHRTFCGSHWRVEVEFLSTEGSVLPALGATLALPAHFPAGPGDTVAFHIKGPAHALPPYQSRRVV